METAKPQEGTWTLIAPDGRTWRAESPLRCVGLEHRERVPPEISLKRIWTAFQHEADDVAAHVAAERKACGKLCHLVAEVFLARRIDALADGNTDAALIFARQAQTAADLGNAIEGRSNAPVQRLAAGQSDATGS